jgi:phosphate/sulfate permease
MSEACQQSTRLPNPHSQQSLAALHTAASTAVALLRPHFSVLFGFTLPPQANAFGTSVSAKALKYWQVALPL